MEQFRAGGSHSARARTHTRARARTILEKKKRRRRRKEKKRREENEFERAANSLRHLRCYLRLSSRDCGTARSFVTQLFRRYVAAYFRSFRDYTANKEQ